MKTRTKRRSASKRTAKRRIDALEKMVDALELLPSSSERSRHDEVRRAIYEQWQATQRTPRLKKAYRDKLTEMLYLCDLKTTGKAA